MGLKDPDKYFMMEELAQGDVMFCATGVTDGEMLKGVRFTSKNIHTNSLILRSKTSTKRWITTEHSL